MAVCIEPNVINCIHVHTMTLRYIICLSLSHIRRPVMKSVCTDMTLISQMPGFMTAHVGWFTLHVLTGSDA